MTKPGELKLIPRVRKIPIKPSVCYIQEGPHAIPIFRKSAPLRAPFPPLDIAADQKNTHFKIVRNSKKKREIFRFALWKKLSTAVENWDNLLIIGHKISVPRTDFISTGYSFILARNEYFQGHFGCGKLEKSGFRKWPKPHLTIPQISGSLTN